MINTNLLLYGFTIYYYKKKSTRLLITFFLDIIQTGWLQKWWRFEYLSLGEWCFFSVCIKMCISFCSCYLSHQWFYVHVVVVLCLHCPMCCSLIKLWQYKHFSVLQISSDTIKKMPVSITPLSNTSETINHSKKNEILLWHSSLCREMVSYSLYCNQFFSVKYFYRRDHYFCRLCRMYKYLYEGFQMIENCNNAFFTILKHSIISNYIHF